MSQSAQSLLSKIQKVYTTSQQPSLNHLQAQAPVPPVVNTVMPASQPEVVADATTMPLPTVEQPARSELDTLEQIISRLEQAPAEAVTPQATQPVTPELMPAEPASTPQEFTPPQPQQPDGYDPALNMTSPPVLTDNLDQLSAMPSSPANEPAPPVVSQTPPDAYQQVLTPEPAVMAANFPAQPGVEDPHLLQTEMANPDQAASPGLDLPPGMAQVMPQVIDQATDTLNPQGVYSGVRKEMPLEGATALNPVEASASVQVVENERNPEIPVEVEAYLQKVEEHADQELQEVVISGDANQVSTRPYQAQPVVVLPISPEEEKTGKGKSAKFSIRWLVEFSRKIMRVFAGETIYRQE